MWILVIETLSVDQNEVGYEWTVSWLGGKRWFLVDKIISRSHFHTLSSSDITGKVRSSSKKKKFEPRTFEVKWKTFFSLVNFFFHFHVTLRLNWDRKLNFHTIFLQSAQSNFDKFNFHTYFDGELKGNARKINRKLIFSALLSTRQRDSWKASDSFDSLSVRSLTVSV